MQWWVVVAGNDYVNIFSAKWVSDWRDVGCGAVLESSLIGYDRRRVRQNPCVCQKDQISHGVVTSVVFENLLLLA